jgi:hypothetical protein
VHPTLGILPRFQAFFYALAFFWLDGFAVPAPAQVTQTVGLPIFVLIIKILYNISNQIVTQHLLSTTFVKRKNVNAKYFSYFNKAIFWRD